MYACCGNHKWNVVVKNGIKCLVYNIISVCLGLADI